MSSVCVDFCVKKSRLVTENTDVITMRAVDVTKWGTAKSLQDFVNEHQLEAFLVIDDSQSQY